MNTADKVMTSEIGKQLPATAAVFLERHPESSADEIIAMVQTAQATRLAEMKASTIIAAVAAKPEATPRQFLDAQAARMDEIIRNITPIKK